mgnify:CR=1 FL=1
MNRQRSNQGKTNVLHELYDNQKDNVLYTFDNTDIEHVKHVICDCLDIK